MNNGQETSCKESKQETPIEAEQETLIEAEQDTEPVSLLD